MKSSTTKSFRLAWPGSTKAERVRVWSDANALCVQFDGADAPVRIQLREDGIAAVCVPESMALDVCPTVEFFVSAQAKPSERG